MKRLWIYLSGFGISFAALSWIQEIQNGEWIKGALAAVLGFILYRGFIYRGFIRDV